VGRQLTVDIWHAGPGNRSNEAQRSDPRDLVERRMELDRRITAEAAFEFGED
jgi:hypothetical protein